MHKKLNRIPRQTFEIYSEALVHIGMTMLNKIYSGIRIRRCPKCGHALTENRERTLYLWAADPAFCEVVRQNPIDRLRIMIREFIRRDRKDIAVALADIFAADVGGRLYFDRVEPGCESYLEETLETHSVSSRFHDMAQACLKTGEYSVEEVRAAAREVIREVEEDLAAFIKEYKGGLS